MPTRRHIVVVEPDALVAAAISSILESLGYLASIAHDGSGARGILRDKTKAVHAVVLAAVLPGEDGASVAKYIGDLGLPLVMISGNDRAMKMAAERGLQLLHKPFGSVALFDAVVAALSSGVAGWRKSNAADDVPYSSEAQRGREAADTAFAPEKVRHWRMKAEELRIVADQMKSFQAQQSYRRLADTYDALADRMESIATSKRKSEPS